jgi:arylsulfatase A-like enzyme
MISLLTVSYLLFPIVFGISSSSGRTNVILYVPDELRAESMSLYGGPAKTPNFERFASQGTAFSNAYSTYPVCTQSRASFLTGRYTHSAGHRSLWDPLRYYEPNLLAYAKQAGYSVFMAGKNDAMDKQSFNRSVSESGEWGSAAFGRNSFSIDDPRYYSFISDETKASLSDVHDTSCVNKAIDFLSRRNESGSTDPFFIYLPLIEPHPPYGCPSPFYGFNGTLPSLRPFGLSGKPDFHDRIRYYRNATKWENGTLETVQSLYLGCVEYSDYVFGTLLDALTKFGLDETNTAIVITSDHGDYAGDFGLVEKWPSGLEDVLLRVPFIVRVPGSKPNQVIKAQIQHFDLVPTLLDVMNIKLQHVQFGISQLPLLLGTVIPDENRSVYAEGGYSSLEQRDFEGDCTDPLREECDPTSIYYPKGYQEWNEKITVCRSVMIRTLSYKLIRRSDPLDVDHDSELYDLINDPLELSNQYTNPAFATIRADLSERLLQWLLQTSSINVLPFTNSSLVTSTLNNGDEIPRSMYFGNWTT